MPAIKRLPDSASLRRMRMQGWTQKKIADTYGVSESAVWKALQRAGYTNPRKTTRDILPWDVKPEHRATAIMDRFRSILKQQRGIPLTPEDQRLLRQWLKDLEASGLVVAYHPEAPRNSASTKGGFYYTKRSPEDEWIIRKPDLS